MVRKIQVMGRLREPSLAHYQLSPSFHKYTMNKIVTTVLFTTLLSGQMACYLKYIVNLVKVLLFSLIYIEAPNRK